MDKINLVLISLAFACGVGTGFYLGKRKYEGIADKEVESVKRYFEERYVKHDIATTKKVTKALKDIPKVDPAADNRLTVKKDIKDYKDYSKPYQAEGSVERIPGASMGNVEKELTEEERHDSDGPYIIAADEFNESSYEAQTLFFYVDRVLADDAYNIVDDIAGTVGVEALASFGDSDCVYVRNDELGIDYEILIDERYFGKIANRKVPGLDNDPE